jgi:hypothetical protein
MAPVTIELANEVSEMTVQLKPPQSQVEDENARLREELARLRS